MLINGVIKTGIDAILEFVYPSNCLVCNEYIEQSGELVCPDCWNKIKKFDFVFCDNCKYPISGNLICSNCSEHDSLSILALGHYMDPLDEIIRNFKYRSFQKLGINLAERLIDSHSKLLDKLKIDFIIPIPLHSYRLKTRGFNQSLILANTIGKNLDVPVLKDGLVKTKHNKYQKSLNPEHRDKNVENVYEIGKDEIENKNILLIDDVITTGATLHEAKRILSMAGGKVILAAVIAATDSGK